MRVLLLILCLATGTRRTNHIRAKRWTGHKHQIQIPFYFDESFSSSLEKQKIRRTINQLNSWIDCAYVFEVDERYQNPPGKKRSSQDVLRITKPSGKKCSNVFDNGRQDLLVGEDCLYRGTKLQRHIIHSLYSRLRKMSA